MNIKQKARELKNKIAALFLALRKKETPLYAKIAIAVTVGYALSKVCSTPLYCLN